MSGKRKHAINAKRHFKHAKFSDGGASRLEPGMVGVLVSHDRNKEKFCRLDSFRLLNYFADKLYGPEKMEQESKIEDTDIDCDDIESALSTEVSDIKGQTEQKSQHRRRFSTVKSGCNNLVFVRFREISPSALMKNIVENISSCENLEESDIPFVKSVLRVHPVEFTCPAYLDNMCKNIPPFLNKKFLELSSIESEEYTIDYKCRNNSHLSRQSVLDGLIKDLRDSPSGWKYNCRAQTVSVIIDVLKTVCLVSVVMDYGKYKKYNIRELLQPKGISREPPKMRSDDAIKESNVKSFDGKYDEIESSTAGATIAKGDTKTDKPSGDPGSSIETAKREDNVSETVENPSVVLLTETQQGQSDSMEKKTDRTEKLCDHGSNIDTADSVLLTGAQQGQSDSMEKKTDRTEKPCDHGSNIDAAKSEVIVSETVENPSVLLAETQQGQSGLMEKKTEKLENVFSNATTC